MTISQIKNFRQLGYITAGHPEYEPDAGIEITTGPLGQGISNAVGMAIALKKLSKEKQIEIDQIKEMFDIGALTKDEYDKAIQRVLN